MSTQIFHLFLIFVTFPQISGLGYTTKYYTSFWSADVHNFTVF